MPNACGATLDVCSALSPSYALPSASLRSARSTPSTHSPHRLGSPLDAPASVSPSASPSAASSAIPSAITSSAAAPSGSSVHLVLKHGVPWRGSYARALRLTPSALQTLSANAVVTNSWGWDQVVGATRVPGSPAQLVIHVAIVPKPAPTVAPTDDGGAKRCEEGAPAACLLQPWRAALHSLVQHVSWHVCVWSVPLRFEAADEEACVRLLLRVRAAAERGVMTHAQLDPIQMQPV